MLKREIVVPPEHLYPPDEWRVIEARYSEEFFERAETIFSLGNGFVGVRGTFEEGRPALSPGTFINGVSRDVADRACGGGARAGPEGPEDHQRA